MPEPRELRIGRNPVVYAGTARTRVYGVIGHPVRHSLSPRFQNAALQALGLDAAYVAVDVEPAELEHAVARMRAAAAGGILGGMNVTVPHKTALLPHLDRLDDLARQAGAVNTVCFETPAGAGGVRLVGANTDVDGMLDAVGDAGATMAGVPVVIVGAGGMARAAVVAALRAGAAEIRVLNRSLGRACALLDALAESWRGALPRLACAGLDQGAESALRGARVLVQATSLGLAPGDASPVDLRRAPDELFVLETIYNPPETALLSAARARGLRAVNGLGLLLHQGARSLRLWTEREPPLEVMRRSLGIA